MWALKVNLCLDHIAPWKSKKVKSKRYSLPKEILDEVKKCKELHRRYKKKVKNGEVDHELRREFK